MTDTRFYVKCHVAERSPARSTSRHFMWKIVAVVACSFHSSILLCWKKSRNSVCEGNVITTHFLLAYAFIFPETLPNQLLIFHGAPWRTLCGVSFIVSLCGVSFTVIDAEASVCEGVLQQRPYAYWCLTVNVHTADVPHAYWCSTVDNQFQPSLTCFLMQKWSIMMFT